MVGRDKVLLPQVLPFCNVKAEVLHFDEILSKRKDDEVALFSAQPDAVELLQEEVRVDVKLLLRTRIAHLVDHQSTTVQQHTQTQD